MIRVRQKVVKGTSRIRKGEAYDGSLTIDALQCTQGRALCRRSRAHPLQPRVRRQRPEGTACLILTRPSEQLSPSTPMMPGER